MEHDYKNLIWRLELTKEPLSLEAAEALKRLIDENKNLKESYDAMFRDLQRERDKNRM